MRSLRSVVDHPEIEEVGLTEDELHSLIAECPEHTRRLVIVAADTGMRRSELRRLTWEDVDFEIGTLTVRKSKNKDYRVIPMTEKVRELLLHLRSAPDCEETSVLPVGDVKRSLHTAAIRAGIGHVHMHQLRHTPLRLVSAIAVCLWIV